MDNSVYIYGMKCPNRIFVGGLPKCVSRLCNFYNFKYILEIKVSTWRTGYTMCLVNLFEKKFLKKIICVTLLACFS